jgi:hypothetical protein
MGALPNNQSVILSPPALRGRTIVGVSNGRQSKTTSKAIHDTFEINEIPAVDAEVILLCYSISFISNLNNKPLFHPVLLERTKSIFNEFFQNYSFANYFRCLA